MPGRIQKVVDVPRFDQGSLTFSSNKVVTYMVDTPGPPLIPGGPPTVISHGPFTVTIPAEAFTSEVARRLVDEQAAHIEKLFP